MRACEGETLRTRREAGRQLYRFYTVYGLKKINFVGDIVCLWRRPYSTRDDRFSEDHASNKKTFFRFVLG